MSLISFHRLLIVVAIAFCLGFAGWELEAYRATQAPAAMLVAGAFAILAMLLTVYLVRLRTILGIR